MIASSGFLQAPELNPQPIIVDIEAKFHPDNELNLDDMQVWSALEPEISLLDVESLEDFN